MFIFIKQKSLVILYFYYNFHSSLPIIITQNHLAWKRSLSNMRETEIHFVKVVITCIRTQFYFTMNTLNYIDYSVLIEKGKIQYRENVITSFQRAVLNAANEHCFVQLENKGLLRRTLYSYLLREQNIFVAFCG